MALYVIVQSRSTQDIFINKTLNVYNIGPIYKFVHSEINHVFCCM